MRYVLAALAATIPAGVAFAAPPPPPPPFVFDAAHILADQTSKDQMVYPLFGDDVIVSENGIVVSRGKDEWIHWRSDERLHYFGHTIGYTYSSGLRSPSAKTGGELLIVDTFDTIDTNHQPVGVVMDARMSTRSTLYVFGIDGLIHQVDMSKVYGFWNRYEK